MAKYLDNEGLLYLWGKIKAKLADKVDAVSGKGLSTNDYTDAEKTKLAGIATGANNYTLPTASASVKGGIMVGSGLSITDGVLSAGAYTLPTAGSDTKGGVKIGSRLTMTGEVLSADVQSDNNFTNTLKSKLDGIAEGANNYSLPTAAAGTLGGVKVGSGLSISSGVLSVSAISNASASAAGLMSAADFSKLAAFGAANTYALKTDITSMYRHKGSVSTVSALPSTGNTAGDVYNVTATGMNYVWTGEDWDALGEVFTITSITNGEIDTILAS